MESFYYKEQIHMCKCKALPRCGSEQRPRGGTEPVGAILSWFACVETDSAKLSSVMGELGFEFKPKLKR